MGNKLFYLLGITVFLSNDVSARPQSLDDIFDQIFTTAIVPTNLQPTRPSITDLRSTMRRTTPTTLQLPTTTTAQPPQVTECIKNCPATSQYNPVCGSDGQTYNNPSALRCAQRCGLGISQRRSGVCAPRGR